MGTNFVKVSIHNHAPNHQHVNVHLQNKTEIIERVIDPDYYEGEYVVTSDPNEIQVLETKDKLMKENVTVLTIPYWETSNEFGTTCIIGKESEIYG